MADPLPSSPGASPVQLKDCVEELLKFTLISSIKGKLQTGLSNHYCANLLTDADTSNLLLTKTEVSRGVPSYPLYKHLASSLYQCIHSGTLCTAYKELIPASEDPSLKKKGQEWNTLIMEKGSALLSLLKQVDFELYIQEPYFSQLNGSHFLILPVLLKATFSLYTAGLKTVEGSCVVGDYKRMQSGHLLLFNKCLALRVQDIRQYASFHEMLEVESLAEVLPRVSSIQEGVQIYRNFYSEEKERSNGVLAICVKMSTSQPCVIMSSILSGLSYSGVQKLLGFVETTRTNPELLPPPASTLLSTFLAPHNSDVKGSTLTNGVRALAKHVNRSSEGYWGTLHGSDVNNLMYSEIAISINVPSSPPTPADTEKNMHAMDVIERLLTHCSWMNMHIVRPHGSVFEIQTDDGYGARWSGDGIKFVGFLEPYMIDGYSCGWKH